MISQDGLNANDLTVQGEVDRPVSVTHPYWVSLRVASKPISFGGFHLPSTFRAPSEFSRTMFGAWSEHLLVTWNGVVQPLKSPTQICFTPSATESTISVGRKVVRGHGRPW